MLREVISPEQLKETLAAHAQPEVVGPRPEVQKDSKGRVYATGKRKTSVARVWVKAGKGQIIINNRSIEEYFGREALRVAVLQPLQHANRAGQYDVWCTVDGGGLSGQAGAIRHGVSRALQFIEPTLRTLLKQGHFLRRDARRVERKKPGQAGARRSFQFSKR